MNDLKYRRVEVIRDSQHVSDILDDFFEQVLPQIPISQDNLTSNISAMMSYTGCGVQEALIATAEVWGAEYRPYEDNDIHEY